MTDTRLIRIATELRGGILGRRSSRLMCMAVSAPLQGLLSALYSVETAIEEVAFPAGNHVWLRLSDGRILDATADQFGLPAVYLGPIPEQYREWMERATLHEEPRDA